jgi:HEAT repeat protein
LIGGLAVVCAFGAVTMLTRQPGLSSYQHKSIRAWALQTAARDEAERNEARAAFTAMSTNALPELLRLLETRDAPWRAQARRQAASLPSRLQQVVLRWAGPPAANVRESAARSVGIIGPDAQAAIPALTNAMHDLEGRVRWTAAEALGRISGPRAVAGLVTALQDPDLGGPEFAAYALRLAKPETEAGLTALARALQDTNSQPMAVWNLTRMGKTAKPVLEQLSARGDDNARAIADRLMQNLQTNTPAKGPPAH